MSLTKEQRRIVNLVLGCYTNPEIAKKMGCSVTTIKRKLRDIYDFMAVKNRVGLVRKVIMSVSGINVIS